MVEDDVNNAFTDLNFVVRFRQLEIQTTSNTKLIQKLLEKIKKLEDEISFNTKLKESARFTCCCCGVMFKPLDNEKFQFICCVDEDNNNNSSINKNNYIKCDKCVCIIHINSNLKSKVNLNQFIEKSPENCCLKRVSSALDDCKKENERMLGRKKNVTCKISKSMNNFV